MNAEEIPETTESWQDRIIKTEQTRMFGFAEFSAL
jgi:hypothetical protein